MHTTAVSIGSLTTRFYKGLSLYHSCKPNLRVSSSRASFIIRNRHSLYATASTPQQMKRKAPLSTAQASSAKRTRVEVPEYHLTPPVRDENGIIWPAPEAQMKKAREIILNW